MESTDELLLCILYATHKVTYYACLLYVKNSYHSKFIFVMSLQI